MKTPFASFLSARRALAAFAVALCVFALPSTVLAAASGDTIDWSSLRVKPGTGGLDLVDGTGRRVAYLESSKESRDALRAEIVGDTLELDLRGAFAAGARQARFRVTVPSADRFAGRSVSFAATIRATDAPAGGSPATVRAMPCGTAGGRHWRATWDSIVALWNIPPVARRIETSAPVPADITELCLDLVFLAPGDGKIQLGSLQYGDFTILAEEPDAEAMPTETSAPNPLPGPLRGSAAFWFDVPAAGEATPGKPRTLFSLTPDGAEPAPGDAALSLVLDGRRIEWKRNDLLGEGTYRSPEISEHISGRHSFIISWDERGCLLYLDGRPFPPGLIDLQLSPVRTLLSRRLPLAFREDAEQKTFRATSGDGVTGLRLFGSPTDRMRARQIHQDLGGTPPPDYNGWATPWRAPSDPPPPNPTLLPPGKRMETRLLEDVSPAALSRSGDARFRSTGTFRTGTLDGLEYLEAGDGFRDRFAIRFQVDPAIDLFCFEVTYPDDKTRSIDITVANSKKHSNDYSLGAGIETGVEHPISGHNAVKRYFYWPRKFEGPISGDLAFVAMTNGEGEPAAISRIRLFEVVGAALPPAPQRLAAPVAGRTRRFALRYEDPAIAYDFGCGGGMGSVRNVTLDVDRIASYMKFIGADALVYPGAWYCGLIGDGDSDYNPRRHPPHYLLEACRRFGRDGLSLYASINQEQIINLPAHLTLRQLTDGSLHDSSIAILSNGYPNWGKWHFHPTYYNISHPAVQKHLLNEIDALLDECAGEPAFKGICFDLFNSINIGWWGSAEAGYNDYSIVAFEKATGLKVAPDTDRSDPARGRAYHDWLRANAWDEWLDWRCEVVADFYARIADRLRARRPDLELWVAASPPWRPDMAKRPDLRDPGIIEKTLREAGIDAAKLAAVPNLAFGELSMPHWWRDELRKTENCPEGAREYVRELPESPGMHAAARKTRYPFALFHDSYYETDIGGPIVRNQWGRKGDGRLEGDWLDEHDWRVTCFNPSGREALRPYASALAHGDLLAFARGGFLVGTSGTEDVLRPFVANFRALPAVVFQDVALPAGSPAAARLRKATVEGRTWYYALNTGHVPCQIPLKVQLLDALTGKPVSSPLQLDAYELKALRAP